MLFNSDSMDIWIQGYKMCRVGHKDQDLEPLIELMLYAVNQPNAVLLIMYFLSLLFGYKTEEYVQAKARSKRFSS